MILHGTDHAHGFHEAAVCAEILHAGLISVVLPEFAARMEKTPWFACRIAPTLLPESEANRHRLFQAVWGPDYGDETEYLRQLRKKIETDPQHPRYIHTEPWVGYRFEPPAAKPRMPGLAK